MCHYDASMSQPWPSEKLAELAFPLNGGSEAPQNTDDVAPVLQIYSLVGKEACVTLNRM